MLFGEFLNTLTPYIGVKQDDESIVKLQQIKDLSTLNVPDEWAAKVNAMMTLDSARNNTQIRDHYFGIFSNGIDAKVEQIMEALGVDEETANEIKAEKKSVQRVEKLVNKIKDLEAKKAGTKGGDKKEYEDKITELNNQVKAEKDKTLAEIANVNNTWHDKLRQIEQEKIYSSFEYGVDLPKDVLVTTVNQLVSKKLADKKYKTVYDADKNIISLKTDSDMEVFENNTPVNFKDFATAVVSENKLLRTSGQPKAAQQSGNGQYVTEAAKGGVNTSAFNAAVDDLISKIKN